MQSKVVNESDFFKSGPTMEVLLPSNTTVSIRERNGEDEDILSRVKDNKDGTAINKFISAITVPRLTEVEVNSLPSKDKYYLMLMSRIQSLGPELSFTYAFQNDSTKYPFVIDLNQYTWDFSNPDFPGPNHKDYFKYRCTPYPPSVENGEFEISISSGKTFKMHFLTGVGESKALTKTLNELTINDRLRIRDFQMKKENSWIPIERFNIFTSREMTEIRKLLQQNDEPFELYADLVNPKSGAIETVSLFQVEDFFFPMTL